jgi:hypothetical protein
MQIERILQNEITILTARRNEGKTMALLNMILKYKKKYVRDVWVYGVKSEIIDNLERAGIHVKVFYSVREMERIRDAIIFADEAGQLLNVVNRKQHEEMLRTLRLVSHQNNRIVLCGLPFDFKKLFSAQATCFLYKSLNIAELINGSTIKETLLEYKEYHLGAYTLSVPKNQILCYDSDGFWMDEVNYYAEYDSKTENVNLFAPKKIKQLL